MTDLSEIFEYPVWVVMVKEVCYLWVLQTACPILSICTEGYLTELWKNICWKEGWLDFKSLKTMVGKWILLVHKNSD